MFFLVSLIIVLSMVKMKLYLKILVLIEFLFKATYSYYMYYNGIINFPDTYHYIEVLNKMIYSKSISYINVTRYAGTLHVGYHYINYFIFKIFNTKLALYLINSFLSSISILLFYNHIKNKFNKNMANIATILLLLSANIFIFTSNILKDSLVLFLAMYSIYIYDKYSEKRNISSLILLILSLTFLTITRIYSGIGFAVGIMVDYLISNKIVIKKKNIIFFTLALIGVIIYSPLKSYTDMGVRFINRIGMSFGAIKMLLKGAISLFFSPLFWNMTAEYTMYTPIVLDSTFFLVFSIFLILFLYKFIKYKEYRQKTYIYIVPIIFHIIALGAQYETGGVRQKIAVYPFIIILYILGIYNISNKSEMSIDENNKQIKVKNK